MFVLHTVIACCTECSIASGSPQELADGAAYCMALVYRMPQPVWVLWHFPSPVQVVLPMLFNDVVDLSCPTGESSGAKCVETDQSWMTQNQVRPDMKHDKF